MATETIVRLSVSVDGATDAALCLAAGAAKTSKTKHAAAILRKALKVTDKKQ